MEISSKPTDLLISVARITFLSLSEKIILLKNIDSSQDLALLSIEEIGNICGRQIRKSVIWDGVQNRLHAQREVSILESKAIGFLSYSDGDYPALLKETHNPPLLLFYRGNKNCLTGRSVSVVGTRHIGYEARQAAVSFAEDAVKDGCNVISGLANGVDEAAHTGALKGWFSALENNEDLPQGKTIAVLPCGIDGIVPYNNRRLAENILNSGGCLVSEYVPGVPAEPYRFVQRNRIIAALSPATVVIQAPAGSGALITAQFALEYNRDVIFHQAAFCEQSMLLAGRVQRDLEKKFCNGDISKAKLENTPGKYLESGAPVIRDYEDYCRCLQEVPGTRVQKVEQLELFKI